MSSTATATSEQDPRYNRGCLLNNTQCLLNTGSELEEDEVVVDDDVLDEDENEAEDCCPIRRNRFNKRHVPRDAK